MIDKKGLTNEEAKKLLDEHGFNELKESRKSSVLKILLHQIHGNFMFYLLLCAMTLSFSIGKNLTAFTISGVLVLVTVTGFMQEYKADKVIKSLRSMLMPVSIVMRDGIEKEVFSKEIVPGDVVILRRGEKIPADCVIIEEKSLMVDESMLTGESKPVEKSASKKEDSESDKNRLFMGTFLVDGKCIAKVVSTGMETKFGQISKMISTADKELPLQKKLNKITEFMAVVAILFSILTGLLMILGKPLSQSLVFDTAILVIALAVSAFPEGFPVVLITALSFGAYGMAKKNAIVNRMSIIETLGDTTVICSDKTGTITKGEMTVKKIFCDGETFNITGVGYNGNGEFYLNEEKVDAKKEYALDFLLKAAVLCNDAKIQRTGEDEEYKLMGTPTEGALLCAASKAGIYSEDFNFKRVEEIPFSSERKMMSVLGDYNGEKYVFSKGASEIILEKCKFIQEKERTFRLTEKEKKKILELNRKMSSDGLRGLGVAYKKVKSFSKDHFEDDLVFLGFTGIEDAPREEVKNSIMTCLSSGISVKMITGDHKETAVAIAAQIGLHGKVIEGFELDNMTEEELSKIVSEISIFARVRPEHKLKIVKALKMNGEIVTMTGDGVNDAPALKEAHIGVAMGKSGTDISREVSDLILKDDNFSTIVEAIKEGRTIFKNIRKFVSYQLSCNYSELFLIFIGFILSSWLGWPIPLLLAIQILFMNLVTDDLPAITIAMTPSSADVIEEKPKKNRPILNKSLILWFVISGFLMMSLVITVFYISFNILHQTEDFARTTTLVALIFVEIANAYNFLSFRRKVNFRAFRANKYLFWASIISIAATVAIIYTPANLIFGTVPINPVDWAIGFGAGLIIILVFNLMKQINAKKNYFHLEHF